MLIVRDKYGVRPLSYVQTNNYFLFSSETQVFETDSKEIEAGTICSISSNGITYKRNHFANKESHCLFEYIYFLNNKSTFQGIKTYDYRERVARYMAKYENKDEIKDFIVVGVPNTGNDYAKPYSEELGKFYKSYIKKNPNVSRTFILKNDEERGHYASIKYLFDDELKGKKIILIDDSVVRGITMKILVKKLYDFGVLEVHIRVMSPPIINICQYGIDIPSKDELIYNNSDDIKKYFECNSIKYFNIDDYKYIFSNHSDKCYKCLKPDKNFFEW